MSTLYCHFITVKTRWPEIGTGQNLLFFATFDGEHIPHVLSFSKTEIQDLKNTWQSFCDMTCNKPDSLVYEQPQKY